MSAVLIVLALAACSPSQPAEGQDNATPAPTPPSSAPAPTSATNVGAPASLSEDEVVELVNAVVKKHQLTSLPEQCLSYVVQDEGGNIIDIDVREKHDDTCGGDPGVAPRLFSFKLDRVNHQLSTDAMDRADGEFQPID
jgi:hypothetical protein